MKPKAPFRNVKTVTKSSGNSQKQTNSRSRNGQKPAFKQLKNYILDQDGYRDYAVKYLEQFSVKKKDILGNIDRSFAVKDYRRVSGHFDHEDFDEIQISFEGNTTLYNWGNLLQNLNTDPYQYYFRTGQSNQNIVLHGIDENLNSNSVWGNIIFNIIGIRYTKRFGGSVLVVLSPIESYGIELKDSGSSIFINLNDWTLNLYVRLSNSVFNSPNTLASTYQSISFIELDIKDSEVYEMQNNRLVPNQNHSQSDVDQLILNATNSTYSRLRNLIYFTIGFVHEKHLETFNPLNETVQNVFVADRLCYFETINKKPYIKVLMRGTYAGTAQLEGLFDKDAEVTADLWIILRQAPLVVFSNRKYKYIGSNEVTPYLTMGYVTLEEISTVNEITAFVSWKEDDLTRTMH